MNKKILTLALLAFMYQMVFVPIFAIKAYPFPIIVTQPDGTSLTIRLHGDENRHFRTTEDGYLIKENTKGFLTFATIGASGQITESEIIARDISKRTAADKQFLKSINNTAAIQRIQTAPKKSKSMASSTVKRQKAYPLNGSPKALVILANFKDKAFVVPSPQVTFQNLTTEEGYSANGGTGSAKDYFQASSYGKFNPDFIVVGPVTLPQNLDYYGKNDTNGDDTNPAQMIVDACKAADTAGLDFTQFDTDNDGYIDNVFVYYAGYNEAENGPANTIWPHRWAVVTTQEDASNYTYSGTMASKTFDGKKILDYSCTSELKGSSDANMCGIGTFCHEFGHVLGLPDYYDTFGTQENTLNTWDIMDYGAYNNNGNTPPVYSAYDRFYLGYLTPEQISTPSNKLLLPIYQGKVTPPNTDNQAYLLSETTHNLNGASPNPTEFFLLEYRKKTGWDYYLPAEGMLIWHIDYNQTAWDNNEPNNYTGSNQTLNSHMRVYLQPLSGSSSTPGTAFTSGSFTPMKWSGTTINRAITAITKTDESISFKLMGGTPAPTISKAGNLANFTATIGTPSDAQSIQIYGAELISNLEISLNSLNYELKLSSSSTWSKNISIVPTNGVVNATLQIRFNPISAGTQTDQISISSTGTNTLNMNISGLATAPYDPNAPAIIVGKIENTIQFPSIKTSTTNTKVINIKTTDINNTLALAVTGANADMFSVSVGTLTKETTNTISGANITITYKPTTTGLHYATLSISGGGLSPDKVISLNGEGK